MAETPNKIAYRLYSMEPTAENMEKAYKFRFCRFTPSYLLIYKDGRKPNGATLVTKDETGMLDTASKLWLSDCNAAIVAEQIKLNEPQIAEKMQGIIERFGDELEKMKEGVRDDGDDSTGNDAV